MSRSNITARMHPFTIDFITGNTTPYTSTEFDYGYQKHNGSSLGEDCVIVPEEDSYFNTTQNLEDIYSVISKETALTLSSPGPAEYDALSSPSPDYQVQTPDSLERATPSPTQDSGIESTGCSPAQADQPVPDVKQTLENLEKKASKLTKSSKSTDKPGLSYIALIAQAIISTRDKKMTLGDIYRHIRDNHNYYDNEDRAWRNSIRYNLSINECFIKAGKEESGKGNYWAIHQVCLADFTKGDYRRRQARRRARRGTRTLDLEPTNMPTNQTSSYTPMTSSFLGYQSYGSTPMVPGHPYGIPSPQFYQPQKTPFAPTAQSPFYHGNQMYSSTTGFPSYHSYISATPYSYMSSQGTGLKIANVQPCVNDNVNNVIIQS